MKTRPTSFSLVSQLFLASVFTFLFLLLFTDCANEENGSNSNFNQNLNGDEIALINTDASTTPSKLLIQKPLKKVGESKSTKKIHIENPAEASSHTLLSGTVINIPASAFVDENGKAITTSVELDYKEIKTASEIIASGIPMKVVDENGHTQWMQTAGMFDIQGFQNDNAVYITEGKSIEVDFASDVPGEYDFWYFDEEAGNWGNRGTVDARATGSESTASNEAEVQRLRDLTKIKPQKPQNEEGNKLIFNDLDTKFCPELKDKKEIVLVYVGSDEKKAPKNNKWINKPGTWHKKVIKPTKQKDIYQLTLLGEDMYQIDVKLALDGLALDKANAEYQRQLAEYRKNIKMLKDKENILKEQAAFKRLVRVQGFGIYNYDILWKRQDAIALKADFDFEGLPEMVKDLVTVYYITDDNKTVVALPKRDWGSFRFSPSEKNKLLAILPGNKTAVFSNSDFEAQKENLIAAAGSDYVFSMSSEDETIESMDDLEGLLARADQ